MTFNSVPSGLDEAPEYPGRIVKSGETDPAIVKILQKRLNELGCGPIEPDGMFDRSRTEHAVKLFQARYADAHDLPLKVDGKVGPLTWGALFGHASVPVSARPTSSFTLSVLDYAHAQLGVMEHPRGSNRGPQVDLYLQSVNIDPRHGSYPWCVAFTYYCHQQAADALGVENPHIRTAGVLDHWNRAKGPGRHRISHARAFSDPSLVLPGALFVIGTGGNTGHTGIVVESRNGRLTTIEGNTNDRGSREGIGVFLRESRKIADINKGFIDYSAFHAR